MENPKYSFEINAVWLPDKMVAVDSTVLQKEILTVIPPPFTDGIAGYWSAEHLFLASIASCYVHTFQILAGLSEVPFDSITCKIEGEAEKIDKVFAIHKVQLSAKLTLTHDVYHAKAENVLAKVEHNCIIMNSIKTEVSVKTEIEVMEFVES
jgi:organic hydroperoxide reductase OsmC/OhrA